MPRPLRLEFAGAKYHITARGNGGEPIFYFEEDNMRFMQQLREALDKDGVILYAYALMKNHYHLLIETDSNNLHNFMHRLNTSYSMYFRYKRRRPGHCFQGRYGARLVRGDSYLLALTRYIHLNPVKTTAVAHKSINEKRAMLSAYPWSSYRGYVSRLHSEAFVNYRWLALMRRSALALNRLAYQRYVLDNIAENDTLMMDDYSDNEYAIGDEQFKRAVFKQVSRKIIKLNKSSDVRAPGNKSEINIDRVVAAVAKEYGLDQRSLLARSRHLGEAKGMLVELACRACGLTQRSLAGIAGVGEHAVGKQRKYFMEKMCQDHGVRKRMEKILRKLR